MLYLKNECASIDMHFVGGNQQLVEAALAPSVDVVRIVQRMRLGNQQLDGIQKKMSVSCSSADCALNCMSCRNLYRLTVLRRSSKSVHKMCLYT